MTRTGLQLDAEHLSDLVALRRDLHRHPELLYETHRTAGIVAERLRAAGCDEVVEGIGGTGVVGIIRGERQSNRMIGLRADMDALPILEETGAAWASTVEGTMHACGHDGHTTMLLGAMEHLAKTRAFAGTLVAIFQPAEEGGAGAKRMMDDGLFDRFPVDAVFAVHNRPGLPVGEFAGTPGPAMASVDEIKIAIKGRGGHAAFPHNTIDPVVVAGAMLQAIQAIASRNVDPLKAVVVSVTSIHGGDAFNVIPETVRLGGTVRTLDESVRDLTEIRLRQVVESIAAAYGASATLDYIRMYPVTANHAGETDQALDVAEKLFGAGAIERNLAPSMGGEDFAFMLEEKPGAIVWSGNGPSAGLHSSGYDFDDAGIAVGAAFWIALVEDQLGAAD